MYYYSTKKKVAKKILGEKCLNEDLSGQNWATATAEPPQMS